jgi:hypothetical protein
MGYADERQERSSIINLERIFNLERISGAAQTICPRTGRMSHIVTLGEGKGLIPLDSIKV